MAQAALLLVMGVAQYTSTPFRLAVQMRGSMLSYLKFSGARIGNFRVGFVRFRRDCPLRRQVFAGIPVKLACLLDVGARPLFTNQRELLDNARSQLLIGGTTRELQASCIGDDGA